MKLKVLPVYRSGSTLKVHGAGTAFLDLATAGVISAPRVRRLEEGGRPRCKVVCLCVHTVDDSAGESTCDFALHKRSEQVHNGQSLPATIGHR